MEFEKNRAKIEEKIIGLKSSGYDRIHLPGGTAIDGAYYAGMVLFHYDPSVKEMYFLGLPYSSTFHLNGDGKRNKKVGEFPEQTAIRELLEETGIQVTFFGLDLILEKSVPDNRPNRLGQLHKKYFYLVTEFIGDPFTFEGPNPIDGETAAPIWIPASLFLKTIFIGHKSAVEAAIQKLMNQNREYAYALMNL